MTIPDSFLLLLFGGVVASGTNAAAQNIMNDTVVVSAADKVTLRFPSDPEGAIRDGDASYDIEGGKKALLIKARRSDAKTQLLVVTESDRRHELVLTYAEKAPKLLYDWSSKKALNTYVGNKKKKLSSELAAANADFDKGDYDAALAKYSRLVYDAEEPERQPIRRKIEECSQRGQAGKQQRLKETAARADAYAAAKQYRQADDEYKRALELVPDDAEAKTKMQNNGIAWYKEYARRGDSANGANNCVLAKTLFDEAKQASPADFKKYYDKTYNRVAGCAVEQAYSQQKKAGDEAMQTEDFDAAGASYGAALLAKPEDKEVKAKLAKLTEAQAKAKTDQQKEAEYYSILSKGKKAAAGASTAKDYDAAIDAYKKAAALFPGRRFPKEMIEALTRRKNAATAKR